MPGACRVRPPDISSTWICLNPISRCRDMTFCIRTPPFPRKSIVSYGFSWKWRRPDTKCYISATRDRIETKLIQVLDISGGRTLQAPGIHLIHQREFNMILKHSDQDVGFSVYWTSTMICFSFWKFWSTPARKMFSWHQFATKSCKRR